MMDKDQFNQLLEELKGIRAALSGQPSAQAAPAEDAPPADPYAEMSAQARQSQAASDRIQARQEIEANRQAAQDGDKARQTTQGAQGVAEEGDEGKDTSKPTQTQQRPTGTAEQATVRPIVQVDERTADEMDRRGDFEQASGRKTTPAGKKFNQ